MPVKAELERSKIRSVSYVGSKIRSVISKRGELTGEDGLEFHDPSNKRLSQAAADGLAGLQRSDSFATSKRAKEVRISVHIPYGSIFFLYISLRQNKTNVTYSSFASKTTLSDLRRNSLKAISQYS